MKKGTTLMIYQDPITEMKEEGKAELIRLVTKNLNTEDWRVKFVGEKDGQTFRRTILTNGKNFKKKEDPTGSQMEYLEPKPVVELCGNTGNAFYIIGKVQMALKRANHTEKYINSVTKEMESGDYDHLLIVAMKACNVE